MTHMDFDVAGVMPNSQAKLMNDVSIAVMAKSLDAIEASGDAMIKMMEQSVAPNLGSQFDMMV